MLELTSSGLDASSLLWEKQDRCGTTKSWRGNPGPPFVSIVDFPPSLISTEKDEIPWDVGSTALNA